jgi:hypothetical protein
MQRREAVRLLSIISTLPFLPRTAEDAAALAEQLHQSAQGGTGFRSLGAEQQVLVGRIADAVIPSTDTPGALDVRVPEFIDHILTDWASSAERALILDGLSEIETRARGLDETAFATLLRELDGQRGAARGAGHAFERLKSLTVYGYFTSPVVEQDVLKTQMVFDGYVCAPA